MRIHVQYILLLIFSFAMDHLYAQDPGLPHDLTPAEQKLMAGYLLHKYASAIRSIPIPPPDQVRTMAEWEEVQALIITWTGGFHPILREILYNCNYFVLSDRDVYDAGIAG